MPKKSTPATVGQRFRVTETTEFKVGAKIIANYLPEHEYTATDLNCEFVGELIASEKATTTGAVAPRRAGGTAKTG